MKKINFHTLLYKDNNYYKKLVKGYIDLDNPNIGYYRNGECRWSATDIKTGTEVCSRPTRYATIDTFKKYYYEDWIKAIETDKYKEMIEKFNNAKEYNQT